MIKSLNINKLSRNVGWREYVVLPDLGIERIKVKIDSGARTSALHAVNIRYEREGTTTWVYFDVHPRQRNTKAVVHCQAPLLEERLVRDSGGKRTLRPVIETTMMLHGELIVLELTLVSRDNMGFRMLVGRQAIRGKFLIDPSRSFLGGTFKKKKLKKIKKKPKLV